MSPRARYPRGQLEPSYPSRIIVSMSAPDPYRDFTDRLKLLIGKHPDLITMTLSNIFTMRLIGNKTHGDLAEIAISEFINQYMYDFRSVHVGKDLYRAKSHEEDITVINELTQDEFPISLKAYGVGPLQLSTDKSAGMFQRLSRESQKSGQITGAATVRRIFNDPAFAGFRNINVLPLIYDENTKSCNILVFDYSRAEAATTRIVKINKGKGRKHPVFRFYDADEDYICEVRYGDARANALQRGLWTHTKNALTYFDSITNGWIDFSHNPMLVQLFSHGLVSSALGHEAALGVLRQDIGRLKHQSGIDRP